MKQKLLEPFRKCIPEFHLILIVFFIIPIVLAFAIVLSGLLDRKLPIFVGAVLSLFLLTYNLYWSLVLSYAGGKYKKWYLLLILLLNLLVSVSSAFHVSLGPITEFPQLLLTGTLFCGFHIALTFLLMNFFQGFQVLTVGIFLLLTGAFFFGAFHSRRDL